MRLNIRYAIDVDRFGAKMQGNPGNVADAGNSYVSRLPRLAGLRIVTYIIDEMELSTCTKHAEAIMILSTEKKPDAKQLLKARLEESPEVRPFPAAVTRLLAACQDRNATSKTFEPIVECDPFLSVRMLRMVNSPLFGLTTKVTSIPHAVSLLGMKRLKSLAMSLAAANMIGGGSSEAEKSRNELWEHSLGCAVVAKLLANRIPSIETEDAFLGGVFHDVGKLVFFDILPEEYAQLQTQSNHDDVIFQESQQFGTTHEEVGLNSAHSWGLPKQIKSAIGSHHDPQSASVHQEFAELSFHANALARTWGLGSEITLCETNVKEKYNLTDEDFSGLKSQAEDELASMLSEWSRA